MRLQQANYFRSVVQRDSACDCHHQNYMYMCYSNEFKCSSTKMRFARAHGWLSQRIFLVYTCTLVDENLEVVLP